MDELVCNVGRINQLGRVFLPTSVRLMLGWRATDSVRISVDPEPGRVVLDLANAVAIV